MNSRERILTALNHQEPDKVPFDLAGSTWTGITNTAYQNLRLFLGKEAEEPNWADVVQQIVIPSDDILEMLEVDTRGLFPLTSHNWDVYDKLSDLGDRWEYFDEWGFTHHFPKENGHWFSLVKHPMENVSPDIDEIKSYNWPDPSLKERIRGLREKALKLQGAGQAGNAQRSLRRSI